MSDGPPDVDVARETRNSARSRMAGRFSALKGDYADKGVGARLGEQVTGKVKDAVLEVSDVVRESKGIIAGAAGLLGLWLARRPITALGGRWWTKLKARIDKDF